MRWLYIDFPKCRVDITYWRPGSTTNSRTISNLPLQQAWPMLASRLVPDGKFIRRTSLTLSDAEAMQGYSVYMLQPGDQMLPDPSELSYVIEQARLKVPSQNYKKRREAGEILFNPYARGTVTVQREVSYDMTPINPLTLYTPSKGWFSYGGNNPKWASGSAPHVSVLGVGVPIYGMQPGETLRSVSIFLNYRTYESKNAAYQISPPYVNSDIEYEVDQGLVTKVIADRNDGFYDLLTEIGEFPETLRFLTEQTKKAFFLAEATESDINRVRGKIPAKIARYAARKWMMARYALLPIFYSIKDLKEVLHQMGREYASFTSAKDITPDDPNLVGPYTVSVSGQCLHRCHIKSRYTPDSILADFRRLVNINIFTTTWELATRSFVIDWVLNVGDFISAVTGSDGSTDSKVCYSVRDHRVVTISYSSGNSSQPKTTVTYNCYRRQVINPLDHIGLDLSWDMNWKRYFDAAAMSLDPILKQIRSSRK